MAISRPALPDEQPGPFVAAGILFMLLGIAIATFVR